MINNIYDIKNHEMDLICGHVLKLPADQILNFKPSSNIYDLSFLIDHNLVSEIYFEFNDEKWYSKTSRESGSLETDLNISICRTFISDQLYRLKNKTLADLFLLYKVNMNDFYKSDTLPALVRSDFSMNESSVKNLALIAEISDDLLNLILQKLFNMPSSFCPASKKEDALRLLSPDLVFQLASEKSTYNRVWYCATKINESQTRSVINNRMERALSECALLKFIPFLNRHIDVSLF